MGSCKKLRAAEYQLSLQQVETCLKFIWPYQGRANEYYFFLCPRFCLVYIKRGKCFLPMWISFIGVKICGALISVMLTSSLLRKICYLFTSAPTFCSLPPCNKHSCFNLVLLFLQQCTKIL